MVEAESLILEVIFVPRQYFIFKHLKTRKNHSEGEMFLKEKESITDSFLFLLRYNPQAFPQSPKNYP